MIFRLALTAALLAAAPSFAQTAPQEIDVTLTNFAFSPDALSLKAGTAYRLHLVNDSTSSHNFAAKDFFAASSIASADAGKVKDGAIEVDKKQTVDVTVTPSRAGTYDLNCTHFMHTMFGMKGQITVQ
ncbi:MAG TPA: cupredoxin domain-containing protein [Rhizomicrobium sp.]|jgi:plastocyanin